MNTEKLRSKFKLTTNLVDFIAVFFLLYVYSGYRVTVTKVVPGYVGVFGYLGLLILFYVLKKRRTLQLKLTLVASIDLKQFFLLLTLCIIIFLLFLFHIDSAYYTAIFVIGGILTGFLLTQLLSYHEFITSYLRVMRLICSLSLIVFVLNSISNSALSFVPTIGLRSGREVKDLFFTVFLNDATINRNYGIFWEPGAFQTFITLAMLFSLLSYKSNDKLFQRVFDFCLFFAAMVSTKSTTAYIILIFLLLLIVLLGYKKLKMIYPQHLSIYWRIVFLTTIVVGFVALVWGQPYFMQVFGKLRGVFDSAVKTNYSTQVRINALYYPTKAFFSAPLTGLGFEKFNKLASEYADSMLTFTLINWFALYGLLFGAICSKLYFKSVLKMASNQGILAKLIILIIMILMVISESYTYNPIMFALMFYSVETLPMEHYKGRESSRRLLFLIGAFKPHSSANGICAERVVTACEKAGYDVTCIVNAAHNHLKQSQMNGIRVYRVLPRLSHRLREWSLHVKSNRLTKPVGFIAYIMNKLKLFLSSPTWPNISPLYTFRYLSASAKLHSYKPFDAVITIYSPINSLLAGHYLKNLDSEIVYIPYFLDTLAGGVGPKHWDQKRIDKHTEHFERKIMQNADHAIVMNSAKSDHFQRFKTDSFLEKYCFLDIPLIDEFTDEMQDAIQDPAVDANSAQIRVLYSGTLDVPQRNPIPILEVFKGMILKHKDVSVQFIGICNKPDIFDEYVSVTKGQISYIGPVSREEAIDRQKKADILLNIGNRNENMVPSKVFDYINLRKPIISTFLSEKDTSIVYLKKYPLTYLLDENDSDYSRHAELLYKFIRANRGKNAEFNASDTYYLNTAGAFVDAIKKVLEKRDGTTHLPEN